MSRAQWGMPLASQTTKKRHPLPKSQPGWGATRAFVLGRPEHPDARLLPPPSLTVGGRGAEYSPLHVHACLQRPRQGHQRAQAARQPKYWSPCAHFDPESHRIHVLLLTLQPSSIAYMTRRTRADPPYVRARQAPMPADLGPLQNPACQEVVAGR